jgi:hypothetical protein
MDKKWTFEHTIECSVSSEFAWEFWTNVRNWAIDPDIDSVDVQGPFVAGAQGITQSKSLGRVAWSVVEVQPGRAVLEFPAPGAVARFIWTFDNADGHSRITQRASLSGEKASMYIGSVIFLETGVTAAMRRLCEAREAAARSAK